MKRLKQAIKEALSARHAQRDLPGERDPAHALGQEDGTAGQEAAAGHARRAGVQARRDGQCRCVPWFVAFAAKRVTSPAEDLPPASRPRRDRARGRPAASPVGCCGCRSAPPPAGWHRCRPWPAARGLERARRLLELRRHHAAGAQAAQKVDHDGQIAAADLPRRSCRPSIRPATVEQRAAAVPHTGSCAARSSGTRRYGSGCDDVHGDFLPRNAALQGTWRRRARIQAGTMGVSPGTA